MSEATAQLASFRISPPYREKPSGGLVVRGASGAVMSTRGPESCCSSATRTCRRSSSTACSSSRTASSWGKRTRGTILRSTGSASRKLRLLYIGRGLGLPLATEGGSTLATQIEKLRHSPGGRTSSPLDKLRQVTGASLKAYRYGPDTGAYRRDIVVDYLNSMPLRRCRTVARCADWAKVCKPWFGLGLDDVRRSLLDHGITEQKVATYKAVLALLCAVREPTRLLVQDRVALEGRVDAYTTTARHDGRAEPELAERVDGHRCVSVRQPQLKALDARVSARQSRPCERSCSAC